MGWQIHQDHFSIMEARLGGHSGLDWQGGYYLPDLKWTIKGGLLGPPNRWKWSKSSKDMFKMSGTCFLPKKPCERTLGHKGLVKHNEVIQNHKNTSFDSLKPFPASYSTIWDDSCGKFQGIATHSQWEGSRKQKHKNHALNQIGKCSDLDACYAPMPL